MDYVALGTTGLQVSRICLGCMSYGKPTEGPIRGRWTRRRPSRSSARRSKPASTSSTRPTSIRRAPARRSPAGSCCRWSPREEVVIATKVHGRMRPGPNGQGLSRKAIMTEIDDSLPRLGTDYVDLYQIHRWDYHTPIEETLEALHDVVKAGKARYIGASSMYAWQFAKALYIADLNGWTRFVSMQNHYNLLYREEEREMLPLCADQGIGAIPWSPLARGRLARPWAEQTTRSETDEFGRTLYREDDRTIVDAVIDVADKRGIVPGPGGAGLAAEQAGGRRADHRRDQAPSPRRRRRRRGRPP